MDEQQRKWHVNDEGRILRCGAQVRDCDFANRPDGNRHFDSMDAAKRKSEKIIQGNRARVSTLTKTGDARTQFSIRNRADLEPCVKLMARKESTQHLTADRAARMAQADPNAKVHSGYVVETGHENGAEVHVIMDNAEIHIFNLKTLKKITMLLARPGQIKRYGIHDKQLLDYAHENSLSGRNYS